MKIVNLRTKDAEKADKNAVNMIYKKILPDLVKIIKDVDELIESGKGREIYNILGKENKYDIFVKNWKNNIKSELRNSYKKALRARTSYDIEAFIRHMIFRLQGRTKIFFNKRLSYIVTKIGRFGNSDYMIDAELKMK